MLKAAHAPLIPGSNERRRDFSDKFYNFDRILSPSIADGYGGEEEDKRWKGLNLRHLLGPYYSIRLNSY